jgi:ribosomal protein S18 acetylase RimI-like enzyme
MINLQLSPDRLSIRAACETDDHWAADLIFSAGPGLFSYVFATKPEGAKDILREAFSAPGHAFSYEYTHVLEVDDAPAGLLLGYPGHTKRKAEEHIQGLMAHIIPLSRVPRILVNLADLSRIKQDVENDSFYILSVCMMPEFQGQGLGSALLRDTEFLARQLECTSLCLDVTYSNPRAKALFSRMGYGLLCSKTSHRFEQMTDSGGLHRMEKVLKQ